MLNRKIFCKSGPKLRQEKSTLGDMRPTTDHQSCTLISRKTKKSTDFVGFYKKNNSREFLNMEMPATFAKTSGKLRYCSPA